MVIVRSVRTYRNKRKKRCSLNSCTHSKIVMFLDDSWGTNSNRQRGFCLVKAGFVIDSEISIWEPIQKLEWLRLFLDSEFVSLFIPDRRIDDFDVV